MFTAAAGAGGAGGGGANGIGTGRPLVMAILILLLFFSAQSDWSSGQERKLNKEQRVAKDAASEKKENVKEKIILDLSLANEKLEETNQRLKIEVLALRRSVRACGGELPPTNMTFLGTPLAELLQDLPSRPSPPATKGDAESSGPRKALEGKEAAGALTEGGDGAKGTRRLLEAGDGGRAVGGRGLNGDGVVAGGAQGLHQGASAAAGDAAEGGSARRMMVGAGGEEATRR